MKILCAVDNANFSDLTADNPKKHTVWIRFGRNKLNDTASYCIYEELTDDESTNDDVSTSDNESTNSDASTNDESTCNVSTDDESIRGIATEDETTHDELIDEG
ncbi:unnamed protein product [Rotaria sp. Silwood1]|nr:unnamed protein product [Rotaria sp. Silwood1]CAF4971520.1 unnamed protein product [Rotaria sp. Silwood1]